ncbi:hypothetical protein [Luteimonas aquatica]|uniref:hypothetical protein n=1 Tax=Luteimonas aquatica TaxID=450364 RepID=UPI001F55B97A|nr:hypothetical protein [Luteimonas aquatica]
MHIRTIVLLGALWLSGCSAMAVRDARPDIGPLAVSTSVDIASKDHDVLRYYGDPSQLIGNFQDAERKAWAPAPASADLQRYLHLGLALSDVYCAVYLGQLGNAENHQRFARSTTSDVGGLAALGLGLLKNSAQIVSLTAGGFAFADNLFRNYSTAYMPSESVRKNYDLFRKARGQLLDSLSTAQVGNVAQAQSRINFYASTCTLGWMEKLTASVAEKVTSAQIGEVLEASSPVPVRVEDKLQAIPDAKQAAPVAPPVTPDKKT